MLISSAGMQGFLLLGPGIGSLRRAFGRCADVSSMPETLHRCWDRSKEVKHDAKVANRVCARGFFPGAHWYIGFRDHLWSPEFFVSDGAEA